MRSSPSPSPTRRRPSCASGSGPSWRAGRGGAPSRAPALLGGIGGAWVTTIHGFCNRLLAGHPVAAGIDPRFRVLDAPEAERAAREAFEEALEEFLAAGEESREDTVAAFEVDGLRAIVAGAHAELRSRGARRAAAARAAAVRPGGGGPPRGRSSRRGARGAEAGRPEAGAPGAGAGHTGARRRRAQPRRADVAAHRQQGEGDRRLPRSDRGGDLPHRGGRRGRCRLPPPRDPAGALLLPL